MFLRALDRDTSGQPAFTPMATGSRDAGNFVATLSARRPSFASMLTVTSTATMTCTSIAASAGSSLQLREGKAASPAGGAVLFEFARLPTGSAPLDPPVLPNVHFAQRIQN